MTRLTEKDVQELRQSYATTLISDETLAAGPQSRILQAAAQKAIESICRDNILPSDSINVTELGITSEHKPSTNQTKYTFRWEPRFDDFDIELVGGPKDGELMRIPESQRGEINIRSMSEPIVETGNAQPLPIQHGRYQEAGWDTETKVWIYEWQGRF